MTTANESLAQTYLLPDCNLANLEERVAKLNRRASKLGVPEIVLAKIPDVVKARVRVLTVDGHINNQVWMDPSAIAAANRKWPHEDTGERMQWWSVTITGESPMLAGWHFVAVLEPLQTDDGACLNLIRELPGRTCPAVYRERIGECDHCRQRRQRNQTFVLEHESGSYQCVGRQCLKDFLGCHADPYQLASWAEMLAQLGTSCEDAGDEDWLEGSGSHRPESWDLQKFLTLTACRIRCFGWLSRGKAREQDRPENATADKVLRLLTPPPPTASAECRKWEEFSAGHVQSPADEEAAKLAIEWAADADVGQDNYLSNINLIARTGTATRKTAGFAASIIVAHAKALNRQSVQDERLPSQHIGVIGQRIKSLVVTCEKITPHESEYGVTGIHKLLDAEGNELVWFASGSKWLTEGQMCVVALTPKSHGEFKGRKQTVVSRLTVVKR